MVEAGKETVRETYHSIESELAVAKIRHARREAKEEVAAAAAPTAIDQAGEEGVIANQ